MAENNKTGENIVMRKDLIKVAVNVTESGVANFEVKIGAENEDESFLLPYAVASIVATVAKANRAPFSRLLGDVEKAYMDLVTPGDGALEIVKNGEPAE